MSEQCVHGSVHQHYVRYTRIGRKWELGGQTSLFHSTVNKNYGQTYLVEWQ